MARPKKKIDPARVEKLAANRATYEEIAADQDCSSKTIQRRFVRHVKRGYELANLSLRARQFQTAMGKPAEPAIYLRQHQDADGRQSGDLVLDAKGQPILIRKEIPEVKPHCTMQIWLGKQYLGQSDKFSIGGDAEGFEFVAEPGGAE